jgi:hypothetical protein
MLDEREAPATPLERGQKAASSERRGKVIRTAKLPLRGRRIGVLRHNRSRNDHVYLFSNPVNAARLRAGIAAARRGGGTPMTIEAIRREFGFD